MLMERWTAEKDEGFKVVRDRQQAPANEPPYQTPPHLARLVKVKCIGRNGFVGHGGKTIEPGQTGWLRVIDARGMVAIGKCEILDA